MWITNITDRYYHSLTKKSKKKCSMQLAIQPTALHYRSSYGKNNRSLPFNSDSPWSLDDQSDAHTTLYGIANKIY